MEIIVDPPGKPAANMAADELLANEIQEGRRSATLRIYRWDRPAISIGRRQQIDDLPQNLLAMGIPIVRRPTGGGAVVHHLDELTYSISFPLPLKGERVRVRGLTPNLHSALKEALITRGLIPAEDLSIHPADVKRCQAPEVPGTFCFSAPSCGDLLFQGRKAAGLAMRVWREVSLIQGSIQGLPVSFEALSEILKEAVHRTFQTEWKHQPLKLLS